MNLTDLILEDKTLQELGYSALNLTKGSNKYIYTKCIVCDKPKLTKYNKFINKNGLAHKGECSVEYSQGQYFKKTGVKTPFQLQKTQDKIQEIINKNDSRNRESKKTPNVKNAEFFNRDYWYEKDFNGITIEIQNFPKKLSKGSKRKILFKCSCGNSFFSPFNLVVNGTRKNCGKCNISIIQDVKINCDTEKRYYGLDTRIKDEWLKIEIAGSRLNPNQILPESWSAGSGQRFEILCSCKKKIWKPKFEDFINGDSTSCGHYSASSNAEQEIYHFILNDLKIACENRYKINGIEFDIYINSKRICIEYNGLTWHGKITNNKLKDYKKYVFCKNHGYRYVGIFEDEWLYNKEKVKKYLRSILGVGERKKIRSKNVKVVYSNVKSNEIREFLNDNHYLGGNTSLTHVWSCYYKELLVGVFALGRPTRQGIKEEWELKRVCMHNDYSCYGLWSSILKKYVKDKITGTITSFSDNRRDTGILYEKLGFSKVAEIKPDYCWCKKDRRIHKSSMRKTPVERLTGMTERQLREKQGFFTIYDCGKTKWNYNIPV